MCIFVAKALRLATLPVVLLICLGLSWAFRLLAIKAAAERGASPVDLAAVATIGIFTVLTIVNVARSKSPPIRGQHLQFYALAGLFGFGAPFLLELAVAPLLPALVFIIIVSSAPIWSVFLAVLFRLEPISWHRTFGVAAGFVATVLVLLGTSIWTAADGFILKPAWIIASLCIPVLYAIYVLFIAAAWPSDVDNLQGAQGQSAVALVAFALFRVVLPDQGSDVIAIAQDWLMAVIVFSEITALLLLFHLARNHGGSFASQANYVAVVSGSLFGILLFDQPVNVIAIGGVVLLVLALRLSAQNSVASKWPG